MARFSDKQYISQSQNKQPEGKLIVRETFPVGAFDSEQSTLSFTTSSRRSAENLNPSFGALTLAHPSNKAERFVLALLNLDRLHGRQSPYLEVCVYRPRTDESLGDRRKLEMYPVKLLPDHELKCLGQNSENLHVLAATHCVMVSGEFFWSIDIFQDFDEQAR